MSIVASFISDRKDDDFRNEALVSFKDLNATDVIFSDTVQGTAVLVRGPAEILMAISDSWLKIKKVPLSYIERVVSVRGIGAEAEQFTDDMITWLSSVSLGNQDDVDRAAASIVSGVQNKPSVADVAAERARREMYSKERIKL